MAAPPRRVHIGRRQALLDDARMGCVPVRHPSSALQQAQLPQQRLMRGLDRATILTENVSMALSTVPETASRLRGRISCSRLGEGPAVNASIPLVNNAGNFAMVSLLCAQQPCIR
jgi:hypothetical protein